MNLFSIPLTWLAAHALGQAAPASAPAASSTGLTTAGMVLMVGSIALVIGLFGFCMWQILSDSDEGKTEHGGVD